MVDVSQPPAPGHPHDRPPRPAARSTRRATSIHALNPDVKVIAPRGDARRDDNVERLIAGYDVILDGTDTFETRYILNDAAVARGHPGGPRLVFRFEGQLTTFVPFEGPCYRCLYPTPPPPELAPGCSVAGVLGVVPGIDGPAPGERGAEAPARDRRHATPAGCSSSTPSTATFHGAPAAARPACPVCCDAAVAAADGRRAVPGRRPCRRGCVPADRSVGGPAREHGAHPAGPARDSAGDQKSLERRRRHRRRRAVEALVAAAPGAARSQLLTDDGDLNRFVNVYLNDQDVRYLDGAATRRSTRARHDHDPARRWPAVPDRATPVLTRRSCRRRRRFDVDRRRHRPHAARRDRPPVAAARGPPAGQAGVAQPDRVGQGPRRASTSSPTSRPPAACAPDSIDPRADVAATPASPWP